MLDEELEKNLNNAFKLAHKKQHEFVTVEHLFLSLLENTKALKVLNSCGANIESLQSNLESFISKTTPTIEEEEDKEIQPTLGFQRVLQRAVFHVQSSGKKEVNGANLLVAIFSEKESHSVYLLNQEGITRLDIVSFISHGDEEEETLEEKKVNSTEKFTNESSSALESFTLNLNKEATEDKIDPLIGRKSEVERVIQILARRNKNNPLLVGESGVGKTAIAEGIAKLIVENKVPEIISTSTIYSLDMGSLLAGTKYRGDFEKRLKLVLKELGETENSILFIEKFNFFSIFFLE